MAIIRWCPIYPKWDIYQPLILLGEILWEDEQKTAVIWWNYMMTMDNDSITKYTVLGPASTIARCELVKNECDPEFRWI